MSKRIKELADNATLYANEICNHDANADWYEVQYKEFAELIVRECLGKISGLVIPEEAILPVGSYEKWNQALGHAALEIEQHFFGDLK
jgi:hypothetical protein